MSDYDDQYVSGLDNTVANALCQLSFPSFGYALPEVS